VSFFETEWRLAGPGSRELERSTRDVADPQCPHELEARQPSQVLCVPFAELRVFGLLSDNGGLHNRVAKVIHHRSDGEDAF
jgi:hypothetical protein